MYIGPLDHGYTFWSVRQWWREKKSDVELHRKYALLRLKWLSGDLYGKHYDIMCVKMALRESKSMTQ